MLCQIKLLPWSQRFSWFFSTRELRESRKAMNKSCKVVNTSHEAVRKKNLWLVWTWISLSCRCLAQDLALGLGLVDLFTNTQSNIIGPCDWQYQGNGSDICHCSKFCLFLPWKELVQFSVYTCSRFARVRNGFCFWQSLWRNLVSTICSKKLLTFFSEVPRPSYKKRSGEICFISFNV